MVYPVKALNECLLRRLTRLDKLQFYCMFLCLFSQCQRDIKADVSKHLLETSVLVLKVLYLFNISGLHTTIFRFPIVVGRFLDTGLAADILNSSSDFNRHNHGDNLMLSKTGFTNNDLLRLAE